MHLEDASAAVVYSQELGIVRLISLLIDIDLIIYLCLFFDVCINIIYWYHVCIYNTIICSITESMTSRKRD